MTNGDGTVPLVSLGYMCSKGWQSRRYNPHGIQVRTREYSHQTTGLGLLPSRGERTGDHVDVLGNTEMITDMLKIAAGAQGCRLCVGVMPGGGLLRQGWHFMPS